MADMIESFDLDYSYKYPKVYENSEEVFRQKVFEGLKAKGLEKNQEYIDRIKKSITEDVGLAIGSTKELVESTLKTILNKSEIEFDKNDDIPKLLKSVQKALELVPDDVDEAKKGSDIIKILLSNF
jgi:hypothetical protein